MSKEKIKDCYNPMENLEETLSEQSLKWWSVDEHGNISYKGHSKPCIISENLITVNQLTHQMSRLRSEKEANAEFYFAYLEALRNAGYKKITIDVTNIHAPILAE